MLVLGIETTCDETSCGIVEDGQKVLSNTIFSQIKEHEAWRGVVPEIASRLHIKKISPIVEEALKSAGKTLADIDLIAVATRPGLVGGLVVGTSFAKALSWSNNIPFVSVNHVEAHLYSPHLTSNIEFPYIGLLVSGGHTLIVICNSYTDYEIVGTTIDDACGEAFDKIAKHYNLGYPGGVAVEKTALSGDESTFNFPTSNLYKSDRQYDVSYSGIKTAVINHLEKYKKKDKYTTSDIAASFQKRAFTILLKKVEKAVKNYKIKRVVVSGGVSANKKLKEIFENGLKNCEVFFPDIKYATDNGAMIAGYGYHLYLKNGASPLDEGVMPRVVDFKISNRRG